MCGVPVHAAETYLERLIRKGFRVAVCEQTEDPAQARKRGAKSVVAREVVRVVTPGTLTEDSLLEARSHNFLAALAEAEGVLGFAWIDISTGAFQAQPLDPGMVGEAMARVDPGELILSDRLWARADIGVALEGWGGLPTPLPGARFDSVSGQAPPRIPLRRPFPRCLRRLLPRRNRCLRRRPRLCRADPAGPPSAHRSAAPAGAGLGDGDRWRRPGAIWR